MATLDDFKKEVAKFATVFGPLKEKDMEIGGQKLFKNETVKSMTDSPGQWSKLRFVLYCESGNIYSAFLKPDEVEQIKNRYHEGDPVKITYTERPDKNDPNKVYYNLEGMSDVNDDVFGRQDQSDNLPPYVSPDDPLLGSESAVEGASSEKPPSDKGKGTPEPQKPLKTPKTKPELTPGEERMESGSIARNLHVTHAAHVNQGWYDTEEASLEGLLRLWMFCKKMYRMELPEIKGE